MGSLESSNDELNLQHSEVDLDSGRREQNVLMQSTHDSGKTGQNVLMQ